MFDEMRYIGETFPPVTNPTIFVHKDGTVTSSSGGRMSKTKARQLLEMIPDIQSGDIRVYIAWQGQWSTDVFEVRTPDVERYRQKLLEYI